MVKPRDDERRMSVHREMADAVGADGDAGAVAGGHGQHKGFVDRLAAEDDAQRGFPAAPAAGPSIR